MAFRNVKTIKPFTNFSQVNERFAYKFLFFYGFPVLTLYSGADFVNLERVTGIEPTSQAWRAYALPLCYTRIIKPEPRTWSL